MKLFKLNYIMTYLIIWAVTVIIFWIGGSIEPLGYSLISFYIILPVSTLIISFLIAKAKEKSNKKWFLTIFFGIMYMLADYATFSLANMITFSKFNVPNMGMIIPGMVISALGMGINSIKGKTI